jgi:hypothetical protein
VSVKMKAFSYKKDRRQVMVTGEDSPPFTALTITLLGKHQGRPVDVGMFNMAESVEYLAEHTPTGKLFKIYVVNDPTLIDKIKNGSNFTIIQK